MSIISAAGLHARLDAPSDPDCLVVLAHGLCLASDSWARVRAQVRRSRPRAAVLAYDHRAHGRSEHDGSRIDMASVAADLVSVVDAGRREVPGVPVVVAGHSLGSMAALHAVARLGLVVDSLMLVATSGGRLCDHGLLRMVPSALSRFLPEFAHAHPTAFDAVWTMLRPALSPWLGAAAPGTAMAPRPPAAVIASLLASLRDYSLSDELSSVPMPATTVVAGTGDMITPVAHARALVQDLPGSELVLVDGGHNLPIDRPGPVAEALVAVLDGVSTKESACPTTSSPPMVSGPIPA